MPLPHWLKPIREKIGNELLLIPGVSAMIFNDAREILLQRRSDNGQWGTIGGVQEVGEEPADAIVREVKEETGLDVEPIALIGVYTTPIVTYPNGHQVQYTITQFRCRQLQAQDIPCVNDEESLEIRYFPLDSLPPLRPDVKQRILDAAGNDRAPSYTFRGKRVTHTGPAAE